MQNNVRNAVAHKILRNEIRKQTQTQARQMWKRKTRNSVFSMQETQAGACNEI